MASGVTCTTTPTLLVLLVAKNLLGSDEFKRQVDGLDGQVFWPRGGG